MTTMHREEIHLTAGEKRELKHLPSLSGIGRTFWQRVCAARNLDPGTVLAYPGRLPTALPVGHDKHWCWPTQLKCALPVPEFVPEYSR